jgi:hypothetical protein
MKPLTPIICSQLILGGGGGGGAKMRARFGGALVIEIGGGKTMGGSCEETTGCGATVGDGAATGGGVMIFGCGAGTGADSTGFGGSFSRFRRDISDSRAMSRSESSSMRFLALTARTISQIASAIGIPRITKTTSMMPGSIILIQIAKRLGCAQCAPVVGAWQAAKAARMGVEVLPSSSFERIAVRAADGSIEKN